MSKVRDMGATTHVHFQSLNCNHTNCTNVIIG